MKFCCIFFLCFVGYGLSIVLIQPLKHRMMLNLKVVTEYKYVHDLFKSRNHSTRHKWISRDSNYEPITYEMRKNIMWNGQSVCKNESFILLMYFVNKNDIERRNVIREYVKQDMVVDGKMINYVFVVASPLNDTDVMQRLKDENAIHGDILISLHDDNYRLLPITILDAFYWVREYCKTVSFVSKVDGDVWIHLGNLIHYYKSIADQRIYSGCRWSLSFEKGIDYKGIHIIPFDYPQPIVFAVGGAYTVSRDVVPFINIGANYLDTILPVSEDIVISEILRRAGIGIYPIRKNITLYKNYNYDFIPPNVVFLHAIKNMQAFKAIYANYSGIFLKPYYN